MTATFSRAAGAAGTAFLFVAGSAFAGPAAYADSGAALPCHVKVTAGYMLADGTVPGWPFQIGSTGSLVPSMTSGVTGADGTLEFTATAPDGSDARGCDGITVTPLAHEANQHDGDPVEVHNYLGSDVVEMLLGVSSGDPAQALLQPNSMNLVPVEEASTAVLVEEEEEAAPVDPRVDLGPGPAAADAAPTSVYVGGAGDDESPHRYIVAGDAPALRYARLDHGAAAQPGTGNVVDSSELSIWETDASDPDMNWPRLGSIVDLTRFPDGTTFTVRRSVTADTPATAEMLEDDVTFVEGISILGAHLPDGSFVQIDPTAHGPGAPAVELTPEQPTLPADTLRPSPQDSDLLLFDGETTDNLRPGTMSSPTHDPLTGAVLASASYTEYVAPLITAIPEDLIDPADYPAGTTFGVVTTIFIDSDGSTHRVRSAYPIAAPAAPDAVTPGEAGTPAGAGASTAASIPAPAKATPDASAAPDEAAADAPHTDAPTQRSSTRTLAVTGGSADSIAIPLGVTAGTLATGASALLAAARRRRA